MYFVGPESDSDSDSPEIVNIWRQPPPPPVGECKIGQFLTELYLVLEHDPVFLSLEQKSKELRNKGEPGGSSTVLTGERSETAQLN